MPIPVTDLISTTSPTDTYPTHNSVLGKGGLHEVEDNTARDAISVDRRVNGMLSFVQNTGLYYKLESDLTTWTELNFVGGTASDPTIITAAALSGHKAIAVNSSGLAIYADPSIPEAYIGISTGAAILGDPISFKYSGFLEEPTWTWTPNQFIFYTTSGLLTQTPPSSSSIHVVATAVSATKIRIQDHQPILF